MDNTQAASQNTLEKLSTALESGTFVDVRRMLNGLPAADVAHLLESSPPNYRHILWQMVEVEREGEVLGELSDDLQAHFLSDMGAAEVAMITEGLEDDDIADILQQVPDRITREVLNAMDYQDRARLERVIQYPDDIAGGLMNTDTITIRARLTLDVVLRYLRRRTLLVSDPSVSVREMMVTDLEPIPVDMPDTEVARLFERNDWVSAPVVGEQGRLLGRITI
jgi:magnesium transporter